MNLTGPQLVTLATDIAADATLRLLPHNSDGAFTVAAAYNQTASPDYFVWRSSVPQLEIVTVTTSSGTAWSWTAFINRTQGERDGWREMFADAARGGGVNFGQVNVRQAVNDIFSGSTGLAPGQRTHIFTVATRRASRVEVLYATGTGLVTTPSTLGAEGPLLYEDVLLAWGS